MGLPSRSSSLPTLVLMFASLVGCPHVQPFGWSKDRPQRAWSLESQRSAAEATGCGGGHSGCRDATAPASGPEPFGWSQPTRHQTSQRFELRTGPRPMGIEPSRDQTHWCLGAMSLRWMARPRSFSVTQDGFVRERRSGSLDGHSLSGS